jgi:dissimilatory sulfite reductase (desulfoviridin) alpha/beta subunit
MKWVVVFSTARVARSLLRMMTDIPRTADAGLIALTASAGAAVMTEPPNHAARDNSSVLRLGLPVGSILVRLMRSRKCLATKMARKKIKNDDKLYL